VLWDTIHKADKSFVREVIVMSTNAVSEAPVIITSEHPVTVVREDPLRSRLVQWKAELTSVLQGVESLEAERDQLRERVAQLEAECKRLSSERSMLLHAWIDATTTEEELDRRSKEPGGRTWAEIKADLEKL
jgi:predicted nuclease with TOPRIM domain